MKRAATVPRLLIFAGSLLPISAVPTNILAQQRSAPGQGRYVYRMPIQADDGWEVASLDDVGVNSEMLGALVAEIREQRLSNIHSVLVVKDGKLVFEEYFEGSDERRGQPLGSVHFDRRTLHDLRSVTKSVTSTVVGIAVGSGLLTPSDPVFSFLSGYGDLATEGRQKLTVGHLLTMTSGFEWDERTHPYTDPRNSETAMDLSESSVRFVLTRNLVADPGSRFQYCGGCTMLLAALVREATGKNLDAFADEVLFRPLGISEFEWLHHRDGLPIAASGLRLRPRDMAKIGYLYINDGRWKDQQVLPRSWIEESTRAHVQLDSISAYGYQWWVDLEPMNGQLTPLPVARGNGGQRIYVVPSLDLVAVITAGNYNSVASRFSEQAFWRFILPASSGAVEGD